MCNYAVAYPEPKEAAMPEDHAVRRDVTVPAEPDEVWEAFATEQGLEGWLADDVELDLRDGGEAVLGAIRMGRSAAPSWSGWRRAG